VKPVDVESSGRRSTPGALPVPYTDTTRLPDHLRDWQLPPGWAWGTEGLFGQHRHYQEIIDALGRSLSLVSAPNPDHHAWLAAEARIVAHRNHPAIPTTYHYWASFNESRRGPGYLRRWIAGESIRARLARMGPDDVPGMLRVLREIGSTLSYLHDLGQPHGCVASTTIWTAPMGRLWLIGWQWAVAPQDVPRGLVPDPRFMPNAPEWQKDGWLPTASSDQWQLAAICFEALSGEMPSPGATPPLRLLRPDCPESVANVIDRALSADPSDRFPSVASMVRQIDKIVGGRGTMLGADEVHPAGETEEARLRWALDDDYEVLAALGRGSFGSVWRVRDLALGREVALKLLHPHVARDERAVGRFRREAKLAAQLAHPAIVPIFDWDNRGDVAWYTMELAEGGSVADLIARSGPRPLSEIAPQVDFILSGLAAAHSIGIVHRDLKPENILIDRYRRWRVADFGIANAPGEERGGTSGTPAFAAPEQLLGELQDTAADCFSAAAIVAFTLSGVPPFGDRDLNAILARELSGDVDLDGYEPEIGEWLARGLAAEPSQRFEDAGEMQSAWREAVQVVLDRENRAPWWRRWFGVDESPGGWTAEPFVD
jgi:eukaryotic-like serine/threonine-protein kinase